MDIAKLSTEQTHFDETTACQLFTNGEPETNSKGEPVIFRVVSEHSKAARRVAQLQKQKIAKLIRRYGSWEAIPGAETDALDYAKTAACIVGWEGVEANGEPFPYSPENAVAIVSALREHKPAHLKQIEGEIETHDSFFAKGSAT